jgi:hypothetical protein
MDCCTDAASSTSASILKFLEKESEQCHQHERVGDMMKAFVDNAKENRALVANLLQGLLDKS